MAGYISALNETILPFDTMWWRLFNNPQPSNREALLNWSTLETRVSHNLVLEKGVRREKSGL